MSGIATLRLGNPVERLAKILKENQEKLNLSKDGHVSVDLSNEEAVKAIQAQMEKLGSISTVKVKNFTRYRPK